MIDTCELYARELSDCLTEEVVNESFTTMSVHLEDCNKCQSQSIKMFKVDRILSEMSAETFTARMADRLHHALK